MRRASYAVCSPRCSLLTAATSPARRPCAVGGVASATQRQWLGCAEHGDEPVTRGARAPQRGEQPACVAVPVDAVAGTVVEGVEDADQTEQRQVGVGCPAQRIREAVVEDVVERVDEPGQRLVLEQPGSPVRLGEPESGQLALGRAGPDHYSRGR